MDKFGLLRGKFGLLRDKFWLLRGKFGLLSGLVVSFGCSGVSLDY